MEGVLLQQAVNCITLGSIYALIALGFSLLFGVLKIIHFSHGDVALMAPFIALAVFQGMMGSAASSISTASIVAGCFAAVGLTGALGVFLDWAVIRRFRHAPPMMALVATVALGTLLRETVRHVFPNGSNPHPFPALFATQAIVPVLGEVPVFSIFVILFSMLAVIILFVVLHRTPLGVRVRAVSQDREAARLVAIDPRQVFWVTFYIASAVGAVGGLFYASYAGVVRFDFGIQAGLLGFSAAVIGGLGSMPGAILGSFLLAGLDTATQAAVPDGASYRLVFAFLLVIVVLVFKPSGLLGRAVVEKV